jgi:hypothetical protein
MSGFRGRGRGGRGGGWTGGPAKGLFVDGVWHCDCTPRKPAVHFEVKKDGPNKGKWFRSCQKQMSDESRCKFFLWDADAHKREAAALSNNSRTERHADATTTPSRRQPSPPPPYTVQTGSSHPTHKRSRIDADLDDDYGLDQADDDFNDELKHVMAEVETPSKAVKTSAFVTPRSGASYPGRWISHQQASTACKHHRRLEEHRTIRSTHVSPHQVELTSRHQRTSPPIMMIIKRQHHLHLPILQHLVASEMYPQRISHAMSSAFSKTAKYGSPPTPRTS